MDRGGKLKRITLTGNDACVTKMLPSPVTSTDESCINGEPFLSHWIFGVGTPIGAVQLISARPLASTRTDCGETLNCFFISAKNVKNIYTKQIKRDYS